MLYTFVSLFATLVFGSVDLRAGINPDLPMIELSPGEVCDGVSYVHPGEMKEYTGTRSCVNLQDHRCKGAADDACYVTAPYQAVAKSAIDAAKIKEGVTIGGVNGSYSLQSVNPPCSSSGQAECQTSSTYPAIDTSKLTPTNIVQGYSVLGVDGAYTDPTPLCSEDKREGCQVQSPYVAVDKTKVVAENIKNGSVLGGVTGAYPSLAAPLATPTEPDLTESNFAAKIAQESSFGFFDSAGNHYVMQGKTIDPGTVAVGRTIFGVSGTAMPSNSPDFRHVRTAANVYGGQGKMKLDCRNGFADGHDVAASVYPSIDDASETATTNLKWGSAYNCGLELWENATPNSSGGITECTSQSEHCVYRDIVTNLMWLNDSTKSKKVFSQAKSYCEGLEFGGLSNWRLPTHRELLQAYVHGLRHVAKNIGFIDPNQWYWTSSSRPNSGSAPSFVELQVKPANGESQGGINPDGGSFNISCVR